jgi:hypothetical protein
MPQRGRDFAIGRTADKSICKNRDLSLGGLTYVNCSRQQAILPIGSSLRRAATPTDRQPQRGCFYGK